MSEDLKKWSCHVARPRMQSAAYVSFSIRFQAFRPLYGHRSSQEVVVGLLQPYEAARHLFRRLRASTRAAPEIKCAGEKP